MIAVDASVAAKWYMVEPNSLQALSLSAGADELVAPEIIRFEVTSAILRRHRGGGLTDADTGRLVREWLADLASGELRIEPGHRDFDDAGAIAVAIRHPFLDCLYIACAKRLNAPLVTADATLLRRGPAAYSGIRAL